MLLSGGFVTFGPMWLSAVLKREGHETTIAGIDYEEVEKAFDEFKPDIVAYKQKAEREASIPCPVRRPPCDICP
jgi:hypothetical protein